MGGIGWAGGDGGSGAIEEESHESFGAGAVEVAVGLQEVHAHVVTDGAKQGVGEFDWIGRGIELADGLTGAHKLFDPREIPAPPFRVDHPGRDLARGGERARENQPHQVALSQGELEERGGEPDEPGDARARAVGGGFDPAMTFVVRVIDQGPEQPFLAAEVIVQRRFGQPGGGEDLLYRRAGITGRREGADRRGHHLLARVGVGAGAGHRRPTDR